MLCGGVQRCGGESRQYDSGWMGMWAAVSEWVRMCVLKLVRDHGGLLGSQRDNKWLREMTRKRMRIRGCEWSIE